MKKNAVMFAMLAIAGITSAQLPGVDDWQTIALWHMDSTVAACDKYGNAREAIDDDDNKNPLRNRLLILGNRANPHDPDSVPAVVPGICDNALAFDGNDIAYSENSWYEEDSVILDFYLYPTTFSSEAELISVVSAFSIRLRTDGKIIAYVYDQAGGIPYALSPATTLNEWNHVVVTIFNGSIRVSVDDVNGSANTFSGDINASYSPHIFAGSSWTGTRPFTGRMDDLKIRVPLIDKRQTAALWHMEDTISTYDKYSNPRDAIDDDDSANPGRDHLLILGNRANPHDPATVPSFANGICRNALSFDGNDVAYAEGAWDEQDDVVFDFHAFPATFAAEAELISVTSAISIRLRTDGKIIAYVYEQGGGIPYALSSEALLLNQWNHVLVKAVNGDIEVTVNGIAGTPSTFSGDMNTSYVPNIYLGATLTGTRPFTGRLDEVRVGNITYSETEIAPIVQVHPRLLINTADVIEIQNDIANQVEPRYSAWLQLKARADEWYNDTIATPYTGDDPLAFYPEAVVAGSISSKLAMAYLLNGNSAYADKAKEILLAWSQASPLPATAFDETKNFPGEGMRASRGITGLVYAYDFIYNYPGFTSTEKQIVENWFRAVIPTIQKGIDRWDAFYKVDSSDPRGYSESTNPNDQYFGMQYYQNHLTAHTMGYLNIGYAIGDQNLVQFAVDSLENPRDYLELFEGTIMMDGDPDVYVGDTMNPPPQNGEVYDRYRHIENHGLVYAHLTLSQMTAMAESLFANGVDVYSRTGNHGETLEYPFDFYADFYRLNDASIKGGFYSGESIPLGTNSAYIALWEVANKRYPGNPEIEDLLNSVNRGAIDPSGTMDLYFCYPVLTHGVPLTGGVITMEAFPDYRMEWPTALGRNYKVLRTTDLEEPSWEEILNTNATRGTMSFTDRQGPQFSNVFYRVSIE